MKKSLTAVALACVARLTLATEPQGVAQDAPPSAKPSTPNIVYILTDDLGYNDLSCYGSPSIRTPNIDRMAAEGLRLTDFYVTNAVCTPSRAAFLTGCYARRVSMTLIPAEPGAPATQTRDVCYADSVYGLHPDEVTIAEILKPRGYATALIGKWHLGDAPEFSPNRQGFDYFFGLPYSNDMRPPVLLRNSQVVANPINQEILLEQYTEEAVKFIRDHKDKPFFLYFAHNAPHTPLHTSDRFKGKSARGLYGDVVESIDWSVGQVLDTLKEQGLDDNTLVVFTSDNGPWNVRGEQGGSATPLRSGKKTTYEGGVRVPCVVRWPGKTPAGKVSRELVVNFDFLPTFAAITGATLDSSRRIDGKSILPILTGQPDAKTPHDAFFYYDRNRLNAVRSGKWKFKVETTLMEDYGYGKLEQPDAKVPAALYNLEWDPGEQKDVSKDHPDVAKELRALLAAAREDLGDERRGVEGNGVRPIGRVATPISAR